MSFQSSNIKILSYGVRCAAANWADELLASLINNSSEMGKSEDLAVQSDDGQSELDVYVNEIEEYKELEFVHRTILYANQALEEAMEKVDENFTAEKVLIQCMLPSLESTRTDWFDLQEIEESLKIADDSLKNAMIEFNYENEGAVSSLISGLEKLNDGEIDCLIFGGVDSLTNSIALEELAPKSTLRIDDTPNGVILGEGAAFIVFMNSKSTNNAKLNTKNLISLKAAAIGNNKPNRASSLTQSIQGLMGMAGVQATDLDQIVLALDGSLKQKIEWHQTSEDVWHQNITDQNRVSLSLGEVNTQLDPEEVLQPKQYQVNKALGYIGAASIPMQMATACAIRHYDDSFGSFGFDVNKNVLVCETSSETLNGAIYFELRSN